VLTPPKSRARRTVRASGVPASDVVLHPSTALAQGAIIPLGVRKLREDERASGTRASAAAAAVAETPARTDQAERVDRVERGGEGSSKHTAELRAALADVHALVGAQARELSALRARARLLRGEGEVLWDWDLVHQRVDLEHMGEVFGWEPVPSADVSSWILGIVEEDRARVLASLHRALDSGEDAWSEEYRYARGAGSSPPAEPALVSSRAVILRNDVGRAVRLLGVTKDITDEVARTAHLRRVDAIAGVARAVASAGLSLAEVLDRVVRAVAVLAGGGCAVRFDGEEGLLTSDPAALHCIERERGDAFAAALDGDPGAIVVPLRTRGEVLGTLVACRFDESRPFDEEDVRVIQEIADLAAGALDNARLYTRADRLLRFAETFVGVLGHDLRNPLGAIAYSAQLILQADDAPRAVAPARRIAHSAARMARMIDQLLDFTRMRLGGLRLQRGPVSLAEICQDVVDELRGVHGAHRVDLSCRGDAIGAWDPDRLSQLVSNLVANALTHGRQQSAVQVAVDGTDADEVVVEVHNDGTIPSALLPSIFEPMHAGAGPRGERSSGLGLGLFIVQHIARAHGGVVEVASSDERGTTFRVALPR
jgi:signal transduction histidine kinase